MGSAHKNEIEPGFQIICKLNHKNLLFKKIEKQSSNIFSDHLQESIFVKKGVRRQFIPIYGGEIKAAACYWLKQTF